MTQDSLKSDRQFIARVDSTGIPNDKSGNLFTSFAHCICATIGAGVLALPYSVSWLGWVAGPILIIVFYSITMLSAYMLASVYEVDGIEHGRYHHTVSHIMGKRSAIWLSVSQLANIVLTMLAFTITGAHTMVSIAQIACEYEGKDLNSSSCLSPSTGGIWKMTLVMGGFEILLSQMRNLEEAWWISVIGSISSFGYCLIAIVLGLVHANNNLGSVAGRSSTSANKAFGVLNSLGSIAFAYGIAEVLPEIQDTLRQPPSAVRTMRRAVILSMTCTFVLFFLLSVGCYSALGDNVTPIILDSFCGPNWALLLAQCFVLLHMLTAFQVYGQPVYNTIESHLKWYLLEKEEAKKKSKDETPETIPEEGATEEEEGEAKESTGAHNDITSKTARPSMKRANDSLVFGYQHKSLRPIESRLATTLGSRGSRDLDTQYSALTRFDSKVKKSKLKGNSGMFSFSLPQMYSADIGFANEEVPQNEEGYLVPLPYRLVIRTVCVCIITLIACIMPFFDAITGFVGAMTYFPLAIYFPFGCYRKVFPVSKSVSIILWGIFYFTLLVTMGATVGSVRNIITGWSTSQIEGMLRTAELDGCVSNLPIGVRIEIYCIVDMKLENDWICVNYPKLNKETSTLGDKPQDATNSSVAPMAKVEGVIHKGKSAKRKQNSQ